MLSKLKWQIPWEPLAARYNWRQGPVPGRGPAVKKHCFMKDIGAVFRPVRKIAESDYKLRHVCPSVRTEQFGSHWEDLHEILY